MHSLGALSTPLRGVVCAVSLRLPDCPRQDSTPTPRENGRDCPFLESAPACGLAGPKGKRAQSPSSITIAITTVIHHHRQQTPSSKQTTQLERTHSALHTVYTPSSANCLFRRSVCRRPEESRGTGAAQGANTQQIVTHA
ncbi:uncharacterized protein EI97DRAFT_445252 [Westerdykella ornata]|uniref:Uncharacterized protein n=1 Tax=Westerdykella ornata TaxID=318751 RepID=A0A6A6J8S0_WESOR|nr:uncharacterized protein EI97DRAFT_445252 [Westerdykella ornata]KAF2272960.1 hypothetical protein EI97DRAFT_445252 [Westerdykella ornata]